MCGICGVYSFQPSAPQELEVSVRQMTSLMLRRGPDNDGFWGNSRCAFGFRRLSILDLSPTGHQPMYTPDERYVLVFNGEIYNFQEIQLVLENRGVCFRSSGDAEVVLYALVEWGVKALEQFNGMFALAFYDTLTQTLLLARDHAGIKPLYYLHTAQGVVFASQYNQVIQHPWAKRADVSQEGLGLYLRFGYIPAPYGLLEHTHLLEPGSFLKISPDGQLQSGRFYDFPRFIQPTLHGEDAVDALDDALQRAVTRHLISDVPVGVFLSGGIDSPLIAAEARRTHSPGMRAFSIGVENPIMNELPDAQKYAQELELKHIWDTARESAVLGLLDDVVSACTEPTADYSIFPTLLVSQLACQHVKVVLSGDGGDELFWGYPSRFGTVLRQSHYFKYSYLIRLGAIAGRQLGMGHATREILFTDIGRLYQKKHTLFAEETLAAFFSSLPALPNDFLMFNYRGFQQQETAQWLRWNEYYLHLQSILLKVDRASMHCSLEVRVPLLDKEVIEVACQTDWKSCLNLNTRLGKLPLRKLLARRVQYQTTRKKGFTVPMHSWLIGPLQPLLQNHVLNKDNLLGLVVNKRAMQEANQRMLAGEKASVWGFWLLLSLSLWKERHWSLDF